MYISVGKGEKTANTGSCRALVTYLEKENQGAKVLTYFFDQDKDQIQPQEVIQTIDQNIQRLARTDDKYFMVTINPSEKELQHIQNSTEKLKDYARAVMEEYALAFNRGITGKDLVYFGKIEQGRKFTGADGAVQLGIVPAGKSKPGLHTHVHIIVSRKDKTQRLKLSPATNHRANNHNFQGGFDKVKFFLDCEKAFDLHFAYARTQEERFADWKEGLNTQIAQQAINKSIQKVRTGIEKALQEQPTLLAYTQALFEQGIMPIFEKDQTGEVIGIHYQLAGKGSATQRKGRMILTRDEKGNPALGVQLERQVSPQVAQRPISQYEKESLLTQGYTDYLTGFISRQGKPFAARLYFNAQNELKFSFNAQIPVIATTIPWTKQECKYFVFPTSYLGIPLTTEIKKQLVANQMTEFLPGLITQHQRAKIPASLIISQKDLGPGFEFSAIRKKLGQEIQSQDIEQVERFLAQNKSLKASTTISESVRPDMHHRPALSKPAPSSFLHKLGVKLGFSQAEEQVPDNRLERLKKRRKRRIFLTLS